MTRIAIRIIKNTLLFAGIILIATALAVRCKLLVRLILLYIGADASEFIELINTAALIIIGAGFGLAVKKSSAGRTGLIITILLLVPMLPSLYVFNSVIDYHEWIQTVSEKQRITYDQAQVLTNAFLAEETGVSGFLGYYTYTDKAFIFGIKVTRNEWLALIVNWGIRIFYFSLSIFFVVFSYKEATE
jgi:hypothetical protein